MECTKDVEKYTNTVNSPRVYVFLAGLDSHLDGVGGHILGTTPLLNVKVVYTIVCAEANRQEAMLGSVSIEGTAFAVKKSSKKGVPKCSHCNGDNHVIETCSKLHGYLDWHPKGKTTSNNKAENLSQIATAAGFVIKSGMSNSVINLSVVTGSSDWIIDMGAADHMTCDPHTFTHLSPGLLKLSLLMPMKFHLLLKVLVLYLSHPPYQSLISYLFLHLIVIFSQSVN